MIYGGGISLGDICRDGVWEDRVVEYMFLGGTVQGVVLRSGL